MNNLVIAAQLSSMEDSIKSLTEQFVILKQSISELNTDDANDEANDEVNEPMDESTNERSRDDLVKDVLKLTAELGWTRYYKSPTKDAHYRFKKNDKVLPIILEDHEINSRTKKGYITTYGWCSNTILCWPIHTWTTEMANKYIINVNSLNWVLFGRSTTNRKRLDPINMSNEQIKEILKRFETIHE